MADGSWRGKKEALIPQLLNLIPDGREWKLNEVAGLKASSSSNGIIDGERSLELCLGLPGKEQHHFIKNSSSSSGAKRGFLDSAACQQEAYLHHQKQQQQQTRAGLGFELSLGASGTAGRAHQSIIEAEKRGSSESVLDTSTPASHTRPAKAPVVGWPPVRNSRKNLKASSLKVPPEELRGGKPEAKVPPSCSKQSPFVKINMEGIPIGRKVDLSAYNNYDKLSGAVQELFSVLVEAQRDPCIVRKEEDKQIFANLLDGTGKYALVYEDNEGDRILVGDVPWNDFVSSAKRLRVLKSSQLSTGVVRAAGKRD